MSLLSNRLKSTEKLIESDASNEEVLVVPPLDLSKCRQSIGSTFSESSPILTDKLKHVVVVDRADIHRMNELLVSTPIPAARKLVIGADRKSSKTNVIQLANEKLPRQTASKHSKRAIDLIAMAPELKPRIKKKLFGGKSATDETTSFITYDEKHETDDANEKNIVLDSDSEGTHCTNVSKQTIVNDANMSSGVESANEKKSSDDEIVTSANKSPKNNATDEHKEGTISVTLHGTSPLRFDASIRLPRVRISIFDTTNGRLLMRNCVSSIDDSIAEPLLSPCCRLKESNELECIWSDDPIHITDDIRATRNGNVVIFFEMVDNARVSGRHKRHKNATNDRGWHQICWAFLKLCDAANTFSNIGIKCCLQLYEYQRSTGKHTIFDEWKLKRKCYPGFITVTLNENYSCGSKGRQSPMPAAAAANGRHATSETTHNENSSEIHLRETTLMTLNDRFPMNGNGVSNTRLPGQQCKCPNVIIHQHKLAAPGLGSNGGNGGGGSMMAKFNPNGTLLAFHCQSIAKNTHEICVMLLSSMKVALNLSGHRSIVYDLDWMDDRILVSVSSDGTAIVWFLQKKSYSMRVLSHPSFVYAVCGLNFRSPASDEYLFIATGGRDCVLRVWRVLRTEQPDDSDRNAIDLCDEFDQHQNYITSLAVTKRATKLYSADWNGDIYEWRRRQSSKFTLDSVYRMKRKLNSFPFSINQIELDAKGHRLYVQGVNDPSIHSVETTSGIVIQSIGGDQSCAGRQTFTFSSCGSLLFKSSGAGKILCWNQLNDEHVNTLKLPIAGGRTFISSLVYHPSTFLLVCTVYGDTNGACMLILSHEINQMNALPVQTFQNDEHHDDGTIEQKLCIEDESSKAIMPAAKTFGTFVNILSRIDDLFALAMKRPNCTDDYKQRKQMEISLQQLKAPIQLMSSDVNGSDQAIDTTISSEAENDAKPMRNVLPQMIDASDSNSTHSNNTFTLEKATKSDNDDEANDDHTFNVENSDENSNATFEIENERLKSPGRSNTADVNS